ncbi:hypothetical protein LEP1GSC008_1643 [Leptospira kirschneri serovar Bulgarica str. Nikolaevo]|uniref:Uncharacterized protein n=1 Tax=Leptospira kirschneri serovar Bulgarica str. Nikolaevo TaxID=1240687 RepID=M6FJK6_9LEPT|nr:hypothetical protein LEP1GSC008_1643 [Leptospira kirschneri serovar Bulgarica str. Nikolaevo]
MNRILESKLNSAKRSLKLKRLFFIGARSNSASHSPWVVRQIGF